jgi:diguanylate cyclase (GGDEF)-like protein
VFADATSDKRKMVGRRQIAQAWSAYSRDRSRLIPLVGYWACLLIVVALAPLAVPVHWAEVAPALGLQALLGIVLAFERRLPREHLLGLRVVGIVTYLVSVAMLRDGAGTTAGFGVLVLLPVVWAALCGWRTELAVALAGVAAVYFIPALLVGAPRYPAGTWRAGVLLLVISATLGFAVIGLVRRVELLLSQLRKLARTDELTGLPNRRAWNELLERQLRIAKRTGRPFTVALLDLDHFKAYNDTHGHLTADRLLREVTAAWRAHLREIDVLARWGGDEFSLLLPDSDPDHSAALIDRLRQACPQAPFSAGVVRCGGCTPHDQVIATADRALYQAKQDRNQIALQRA